MEEGCGMEGPQGLEKRKESLFLRIAFSKLHGSFTTFQVFVKLPTPSAHLFTFLLSLNQFTFKPEHLSKTSNTTFESEDLHHLQ